MSDDANLATVVVMAQHPLSEKNLSDEYYRVGQVGRVNNSLQNVTVSRMFWF